MTSAIVRYFFYNKLEIAQISVCTSCVRYQETGCSSNRAKLFIYYYYFFFFFLWKRLMKSIKNLLDEAKQKKLRTAERALKFAIVRATKFSDFILFYCVAMRRTLKTIASDFKIFKISLVCLYNKILNKI